MPVLAQERSLSLKYSRQRRKRREINYLDSHPCRPPLCGGRFYCTVGRFSDRMEIGTLPAKLRVSVFFLPAREREFFDPLPFRSIKIG